MNAREIARAIKTSAPMMHVLCSEPLGARTGRGNGASKAVETLLLEADAIAARATARRAVRARSWVLAVISRGMKRIGAVLSGLR
jgi:hypothetical protein